MAITDFVKDTFWSLTQAHAGLGMSCPWASLLYGAVSLTLPNITHPCFCNKIQVTWKPKLKFSFSAEIQWAQLPAFQLQVLQNCLPRPLNKGILCILYLWRCSRDPSPSWVPWAMLETWKDWEKISVLLLFTLLLFHSFLNATWSSLVLTRPQCYYLCAPFITTLHSHSLPYRQPLQCLICIFGVLAKWWCYFSVYALLNY